MPWSAPVHRPFASVARNSTRRFSQRQYDRERRDLESRRFYSSSRWRRLRAFFLRRNPLCVHCERQGIARLAEHADHKIPRRERPDLQWDPNNLQGLCPSCHGRKTRLEESRQKKQGRQTSC